MTLPQLNSKPTILFVDDEPQALKYFTKAFSQDFEIYTAENVDSAKAILGDIHNKVSVLVTDQRMPGSTGVDLLKYVREEFPDIIRILTTAYAEIDQAIAAVNSGEIFRYITKPWDLTSLKQELLIATRFFVLQKERNLLIKEKLGFSDKLVIIDRIRSLIALSSGLPHVKNAQNAVAAYLEDFSKDFQDSDNSVNLNSSDFWDIPKRETDRTTALTQYVHRNLSAFIAETKESFSLNDTIMSSVDYLQKKLTKDTAEIIYPASIHGDIIVNKDQFEKLFLILFEQSVQSISTTEKIELKVEEETHDSITLTIQHPDGQIKSPLLFSPISLDFDETTADILLAYFIIYHMGGRIMTYPKGRDNILFKMNIPFKTEPSAQEELPENWIENIFSYYEDW
ncbi:MAG: response regulator [Pseudomonadota bacterium]